MAPLKVYVASATANPETKYRVQRTLMILDGLGIPFDSIDITKPEHAEQRRFMREKASKKGPNGAVLPPQFFYEDEYLGDYEDFDTSVEADTITEFLRLLPDAIGNRIRVNDANKCVAALFSKSQNKDGTTAKSNEKLEKTEVDEEDEEDEEWDEDEGEDEEEEEDVKKDGGKKNEDEDVDASETITLAKPTSAKEENEKKEEEEEVDDEELEGEDEEWGEEEEEEEEEA
ncbi:hypothetical protein L5515_002831 [Caenorhabditis briggsae]|uniref:Uncharacterized protein n=1 Tax=Caenorhabditis briggsae TaxID=6238 RepID=A0AAE9J687_CAEBR|nr:hypothetical protein L5515_002831 [Caenorhabditis briggsae]